jgi:hypothetical protein
LEKGLKMHITKEHSKFKAEGKVFEEDDGWYICNMCDNPCYGLTVYKCRTKWKMPDHFEDTHSHMANEISSEQKTRLDKLR